MEYPFIYNPSIAKNTSKYDVIAFDWDGTLIDTVPYKVAQNKALAKEFGNELTGEQVRKIWNEASGFAELMRRLSLTDDMEAIMAVGSYDYLRASLL